MRNGLALEQAPFDQVQLLDHHRVEVIQLLAPRPFQRLLWGWQRLDRREDFLLESIAVLHIRHRYGAFALLLVGAAATGQARQANHLAFEFAPPVLALAP